MKLGTLFQHAVSVFRKSEPSPSDPNPEWMAHIIAHTADSDVKMLVTLVKCLDMIGRNACNTTLRAMVLHYPKDHCPKHYREKFTHQRKAALKYYPIHGIAEKRSRILGYALQTMYPCDFWMRLFRDGTFASGLEYLHTTLCKLPQGPETYDMIYNYLKKIQPRFDFFSL